MKRRPPDFQVRYKWLEGALPPPYHYEYEICVDCSGEATVTFWPDYPSHNPPVWTQAFRVEDDTMNELYDSMETAGVFRNAWVEMDDPPVGSSLEWMQVNAGGNQFLVPSLIEDARAIEQVYARINSLVPQHIWSSLMSQQNRYQSENQT